MKKSIKRIYTPHCQEFSSKKIILITGPRQSGKTTLTGMFNGTGFYLNYDSEDDRQIYHERSWDRKKDFVIFDELHKMKNWKRWLKGIFDKEGNRPKLVVTGSARMDTLKKVGIPWPVGIFNTEFTLWTSGSWSKLTKTSVEKKL